MNKTKNIIPGTWSTGYKEIVSLTTEENLEKNHTNHEQYFLAIGEDFTHPHCFLEIAGKVINVGFLDACKRDYLWYIYCLTATGELLLRSVQVNNYRNETDEVNTMIKFNFTEEGRFVHVLTDYTTDQRGESAIVKEIQRVDLSCLKTRYPDFGCYDELIKKDRVFPPETEMLISAHL